MKLFRIGFLFLSVASLLVSQLVLPSVAEAGATLYFAPTSASPKVGASFSVTVYVSTDVSVNTVDTIITFPASKLQATSTGAGSPFNDFGFAPAIDNANGTVRFLRAAFGGYTGSSGVVGSITFKAVAAGSGSLGFGVSTVGANDGEATNVYEGGGSASISVTSTSSPPSSPSAPTPPPQTSTPVVQQQAPSGTATPTISSKTHPDPGAWYKDKTIEYAWSGSADGYNFAIDQHAGTQLAAEEKSSAKSASQTVSGDGTWYAHVRAKGPNGWSNTAHFKIQIDATAPTEIALSTQPESPMTVLPTFEMSATDAGSGVDTYELRIDDGEWVEVKNGYKPEQLTSGEHTARLRVTDKAGNTAEGQAAFTIVPLAVPELSSPIGGLIMLGEQFRVSGTSLAGTMVEIYINNELKETVPTDDQGNFSSQEEYRLFPGSYGVTVKAVNKDGITSPLSEPVTVTVDAQAVKLMGVVLPGWGVFGAVGLLVAGLITGVLWLGYKLWRQTRLWVGRLRRANQDIEKDLQELEEKLDERIDAEVGKVDPKAAAAIKAAVEEEIDQTEKEVDQALGSAAIESAPTNQLAEMVTSGAIRAKLSAVTAAVMGMVAGVRSKVLVRVKTSKDQEEPEQVNKSSKQAEAESKMTDSQAQEDKQEADSEGRNQPKVDRDGKAKELSEDARKTLKALEDKAGQVEDEQQGPSVKESTAAKGEIPGISDILTPEAEVGSGSAETEPVIEAKSPVAGPKEVKDVPGDALSALKKLEG